MAVTATASPYGLGLRDDSHAANHALDASARARYRPLTAILVLRRPRETELVALIAVMNEAWARTAARQRHLQRVDDEL